MTLDVGALEGETSLTWLEVLEGHWSEPEPFGADDPATLKAPGTGHRIALIQTP